MILRLGGHLSFYSQGKVSQMEIEIPDRLPLSELLNSLGIPAGEIALIVINGEQVELKDATISNQDDIQLYPPIGGGNGRKNLKNPVSGEEHEPDYTTEINLRNS